MKSTLLLLFMSLVLFVSCKKNENELNFVLMDPSVTGIEFNNEIKESIDFNPLNFIYIYNGAGVGVLDVNQDGLSDLYFAGNNVSSKLYLNKGNLVFEDITETAGVGTSDWATGVSIVDINADGFHDIYLCMADRNGGDKGKNKLFINQGDATFKESAASYGLDDSGYSTQAAFFDYDNDGDLDMYLLTNAIERFSHNNIRPRKMHGEGASTDRLYRNNGNNTFTNISKEAGITIEGYGLGVGIMDVNEDGFEDVYCANDFITNDILWINNGDGTFRDGIREYISQTSYNGMGMDVADFNNDALLDIVEMDMLPESNEHHKTMTPAMDYNNQVMRFKMDYLPQYVRNTLQMRNANGNFSEVGRMAEMHKTDWSWAPLLFDFDNDGLKDLFISNGYGRDVTNLDYTSYSQQTNNPFGTPEAKKLREYENFATLPPIDLPNYFFSNKAEFPFKNVTKKISEGKNSISNGAVYVDLDLDGDLDVVTNNMNSKAFLYQNMARDKDSLSSNYLKVLPHAGGKNPFGIGTKLILYQGGKHQFMQHYPSRGYASSVAFGLHFGLGKETTVDSILVKWPNNSIEVFTNIEANQAITLHKGTGSPREIFGRSAPDNPWFQSEELDIGHRENDHIDFLDQPLLLKMISQEGPSIAVADFNNDGLDDFVLGSAYRDTTVVYRQIEDGTFEKLNILPESWKHEDGGIAVFDLNQDGLMDIYVGSGGNEFHEGAEAYNDRMYLQNESGSFDLAPLFDEATESTGSISVADFDGDGDLDLFVGSRLKPQNYPLGGKSRLLINDNGKLEDRTEQLAPSFKELGMVTSSLWTDFDNDGDIDLIVVGEWMKPSFFQNENGKLHVSDPGKNVSYLTGFWNSISGSDLDGDGDIDYVLGNYGLNAELKASLDEPVSIVAKDFDGNGSIDPIIGYYSQGKNYPYPTRDALTTQINAMKRRYPSYRDYAVTEYQEVFTEKELEGALKMNANCLASVILVNKGDTTFEVLTLPSAAQIAPMYGISIQDYDNDGYDDILMVGNRTDTETLSGYLDSSIGCVLKGNGNLQFKALSKDQSGIALINRNGRALTSFQTVGHTALLVGNNDKHLNLLKTESAGRSRIIELKPTDRLLRFQLGNGKTVTKEYHVHSGYLSQNSNKLSVPKGSVSVTIVNSQKESRTIQL